jgi:hypothetical protein
VVRSCIFRLLAPGLITPGHHKSRFASNENIIRSSEIQIREAKEFRAVQQQKERKQQNTKLDNNPQH